MMKTKLRGIFFLPIMLCVLLAFAVACGNIEAPNAPNGPDGPSGGGGGGKLASVSKASVKVLESTSSLVVTWNAVPNATTYRLRVSSESGYGFTVASKPSIDLYQTTLKIPKEGTIEITITARGPQYTDSEPVTITYELEGALLLSPEINSFNNGVIGWKTISGAKSYIVTVNGSVKEVTDNSYDVSGLTANAKIEIAAKKGGKTSPAIAVMYDATAKKLSVLPVTDYTLDGDILKWSEIGGAIGYKVVDLDFNAYTVTTAHYIMTIRNLIYGVYPVMPEGSVVGSAEVAPVDIKYLEGSGTAADPYIVKTPFDLRAVDYYELKYSETPAAAKNFYKIAADIDYNTVSALEAESNMFTLRKPFFGTLDGGNKTLSNISVNNNNGYWALFEFIAQGATVKDVKFSSAEIYNTVLDNTHPINAATAMVANRNYGTVSGITLSSSKLTAKGGGVAGFVLHNHGTVSGCTVDNCTLKQETTTGTATYEMAGIVLENYGTVSGNSVKRLTITGTKLGTTADFVAVNRTGGVVGNNSKG